MDSKLEDVLRDVSKFLDKMYSMGHSHTEAQELQTRVREQIAELQAPPKES